MPSPAFALLIVASLGSVAAPWGDHDIARPDAQGPPPATASSAAPSSATVPSAIVPSAPTPLLTVSSATVSSTTAPSVTAQSAVPAPATSASIAMLVEPGGDDDAIAVRLTEALADGRADVRAVAARVGFIRRAAPVVPALAAALARESSAHAGAEIARALAALGGDAHRDAIAAARYRLDIGPSVDSKESVEKQSVESLAAEKSKPAENAPSSKEAKPSSVIRSLPAFSAALLTDLATLTGCRFGKDDDEVVAAVTYDADGRVADLALHRGRLTPPCTTTLRIAARLAILPEVRDPAGVPVPVPVPELMLPFVGPSLAACAAAARTERPAIRQARTRTGWVQPVVLKEVRPAYTYDAMKQRAEGAAWVKAVVTSAGCISEVEIVRSLHPHLDVMALRAVSQWRFRPARLDDVPAPAQIVVESTFSMK